jgi:drug/metabolite transporter (DMT)-like permease
MRRAVHLRARRIWWPRLRRRSLFLLGGIAIGILAVVMAFLADKAQLLFFSLEHRWPLAPLLVTPAGFARYSQQFLPLFASRPPVHRRWISFAHAKPGRACLRNRLRSHCFGTGYSIWYAVLTRLSRSQAAFVQLTVPIIAALGAVLLLAEPVTNRLLLSSAGILGGVALALVAAEWRRTSRRTVS